MDSAFQQTKTITLHCALSFFEIEIFCFSGLKLKLFIAQDPGDILNIAVSDDGSWLTESVINVLSYLLDIK